MRKKYMSGTLVKTLSVAVGLLLCVTPAFSQSSSGQISGQVTDPQGLIIQKATVDIVNRDTSAKQETKTDEAGHYSVADLPVGRYQVVVQAEGFAPFTSDDITITPNQPSVLDVKLSVFAQNESITVQGGGGGAQIETSSAEVAGTIKQEEVVSYGLNGRVASQLIALVPGVSSQTGQDEGKTGAAGSAKYSVNGGRVEYNIFEVDGTDVLNNGINAARGANTFVVNPSVDAIGEMKVLTSN